MELSKKNSLPYASVIVPVFNEVEHIESCLKALLKLNYPKESYEIIVIDNGSTDGTINRVEMYPVTLFERPGIKVGAVRNAGAWQAKGSVLGFVDGDCVVSEGWLIEGVKALMKPGVEAVGGDILIPENPSWVEKSWVLNRTPRTGGGHLLSGGSILIKKDTLIKLNGFDENISAGEDKDLTRRVLSMGMGVEFIGDCAVVHLGYPKNITQFARRQFWHGSSSLNWKNVKSLDKTLLLTLFFMFSFVVAFGFLFFNVSISIIFGLLFFCSPVIFSFKRARRAGWCPQSALSIMQVYTLDFCYLLGRSAGVIKSFMEIIGLGENEKTYY